MFILGFKFPATMGNKIADTDVLKVLDESVGETMPKVASIKIYEGNNEYKTITNTDTLLAKGLVSYATKDNADNSPKYYTFTDKYQLAALVKTHDADAEAKEVADFFDHTRAQITLEVSFK